jgi:hypothetical protein
MLTLDSSADLPESNSFKMPAICAGLNVLFFMIYVFKLNILSTFKTYCFGEAYNRDKDFITKSKNKSTQEHQGCKREQYKGML